MVKNKTPFSNDPKLMSNHHENNSLSAGILGKPILLGLVSFFILSALFAVLIYQKFTIVSESKNKQSYELLNHAKDKIQDAIAYSISATKTLSFFIDYDGNVHEFDSISAQILHAIPGIDALQLVPEGVIRYMYPLQGNEAVIGYDILKDPTRNKEAFKAIERKEMFFAGPFQLKQGGIGVVGRLPIYRNNKFWGFSAVIIKLSTLFDIAGIDSTGKTGYYFQLSKTNPDTELEEYFLPVHKKNLQNYSVTVKVPDGEWKLSVTNSNYYNGFGDIILLSILGLVLCVLAAVLVYRIAIRPKELNNLVKIRTAELKNSENKYRSLIERVSDAFVSLDNDWNYTYVNKRAGEMFAREPESLVGKNIWKEFPEGINQPFYDAYYSARETQEYLYLEEYYPPYDKWFENHIYPSSDGITIFFKDVTEIKKAQIALKNKEEKYRSLIEQASDGIVITNMDGEIIEVNNSIKQMIGFDEEDLIGHHITEYLPEQDIEQIPIRIKELMEGKSLLYERRLVRKDGTILEVEVNSKMASTHTLIGFLRDITDRKKDEAILQYQSILLEGVSDAITSLDMERRIISWNAACEELYGFKASEVIGRRIPDIVDFAYADTTNEEVFLQVFKEGQWKGEFNFIHPATKEKIDLLSSINVLRNNAGNVTGFVITSKDISERKVAEEALTKSNERFQLIAEATSDVIWDHDFISNITWGNNNLYGLYGIEPGSATITFEMFFNQIHPEDREGIKLRLDKAIESRVSYVTEQFRFKVADGEYRIFNDSAHIKYDSEGNPIRILGAMMDITERENFKQLLIREKELSDSVINSLPGIFYLYNKEGEFLRWNKNLETVTGYSSEEISKLHPLSLVDDTAKEMITKKIDNVFVTGEDNVESELLLKNKEKIPYYFTGTATEYEGEACMMGIGLDFSDKVKAQLAMQESEEKFRTIVEQASDGIFIADKDTRFIDVNTSGCQITGYSLAELKLMKIIDLIPTEDLETMPIQITKLKAGASVTNERRLKRKDGTLINVEISAKILPDGRYQSIARDITERYEAKALLQKSYEDIRHLASNLQSIREDERTSIAREIHDELGQQLTGLKMDLHWLTRKINSSDEQITGKMQESIKLIDATIASVRKISTDLRPSILDDLGLIPALEWQGEEFEKRSGIAVEFINNAGERFVQPEVATAIFRIYQELLTNIARHANASQVKAELTMGKSQLYFQLTDNGIGFNPESIKNKKTLGLLGIKERSLLLGGTYEFESAPGKGSVTSISIPITSL